MTTLLIPMMRLFRVSGHVGGVSDSDFANPMMRFQRAGRGSIGVPTPPTKLIAASTDDCRTVFCPVRDVVLM